MESWRAILTRPPAIEILNPRAVVIRGIAFVTCFEQIGETTLTATNALVWERSDWRIVFHQSGYIAPDQAEPPTPGQNLH